jgi:hypothetical protein
MTGVNYSARPTPSCQAKRYGIAQRSSPISPRFLS